MKKIFFLLVTAILTIALTACSGAKKNEATSNDPTKTEIVEPTVEEPEAPTLSPEEMLKSFKEYAKAYGEANNNKGKDPLKFIELGKESQKRVAEIDKIKDEFNKKQLEEYLKARDIIVQVNTVGK